MPPRTRKPRTKSQEIAGRLGTYFLGVGFGCMLVILLLMMRHAMLGPDPTPAPAPSAPPQPGAPS